MGDKDNGGDSLFRDNRRDWISDQATRRDDYDAGVVHDQERDRSPVRPSRECDDVWNKDRFNKDYDYKNDRSSQRGRSPDRRSRDRDRMSRLTPDRDNKRNVYNDRGREGGRYGSERGRDSADRDRFRDNRNHSNRRGNIDERPFRNQPQDRNVESNRHDGRDRFGRDRSRNRSSREKSVRNERRSVERDRTSRADPPAERNVDNWGRELRLGGSCARDDRLSSDRDSRSGRRDSKDSERNINEDPSDSRRSRDRDWKKSVDDFLGVQKARGNSPPKGREGRLGWNTKTEEEWDREIKRFEKERTKVYPTKKRNDYDRDRRRSPMRRRSPDHRSSDRTTSHDRASPKTHPSEPLSPKMNKSRDRTPVVDEKSDGEDMVISDDDNNDDSSKISGDEWENMVLMRYKNEPGNDKPDYRSATPQKTVVIRCMPAHVSEVDIHLDISTSNLVCHDIRLVRRRDTGHSRGFAFVEFYNVDDAVTWMELKQGVLRFGKTKCYMEYSIHREQARAAATPVKILSDWICNKCLALNFSKRFLCFTCNASRPSSDIENGEVLTSDHPTNTVVLTGLDALTTEETVLKSIASLSSLPIRSVKVARDPFTNVSKGACYFEMNNVLDAFNLHSTLKATSIKIDGKIPQVKYARLDTTRAFSQAVSILPKSATGAGKIGNTAIAAAQWSHQSSSVGEHYTLADIPRLAEYSASLYATTPQAKIAYVNYYKNYYKKQIQEGRAISLPTEANQAVAAADSNSAPLNEPPDGSGTATYPNPDTTKYQYDPSSGFYYDPHTKLYYDGNSQYYYNTKLGKYLYWDGTRQTYLPTPSTAVLPEMSNASNVTSQATIEAPPVPAIKPEEKKKEKEGDVDRVKVAKRIAKDMEKWAKTLNQKKETAKQSVSAPIASSAASNSRTHFGGAADIGFAVLERKDHLSTLGNYYDAVPSKNSLAAPILAPQYDSDEEDDMAQEDRSHTDWDKLICLLCKRQLGSKEALVKHQQLSDLHKQNLSAWYNVRGLDPDDAQRRKIQYRDRASERRQKYGLPDNPKPSKLKETYIKAREAVFEQPTNKGIGEDNLGNKLLQKMGWQKGMGLGKKSQGRTSIIEASPRSSTAGLGTRSAGVTPGPGETYKDCVKKMMAVRYAQLEEQ